jgi:hypothetical protein
MTNLRAAGTLRSIVGGSRFDLRTRDRRSEAQLQRDNALQRVGWTRRAVIGATAALTAGFAALVSAIAPGHTLGATKRVSRVATPAPTTSTRAAATTRMPPLESASQLGLVAGGAPQAAQPQPQPQPQAQSAAPPVQQAPPVTQVAPPVAVSGGS